MLLLLQKDSTQDYLVLRELADIATDVGDLLSRPDSEILTPASPS
jgi:hypothetical protein